jgi:hypothetical protein
MRGDSRRRRRRACGPAARPPLGGELRDVDAGELIVLADNLREPVTALEEPAFLRTLTSPAGAGGWEKEVTGGRL